MRISLLLQREPFAQILEETLSHFLSAKYGQPYLVQWQNDVSVKQGGAQNWLANAYLNAIFLPDAEPVIFDPIRREYSRSMVPWKRPLQATYVRLAIASFTARRFAQASVNITPAVPDAAHKLLVAGNHKLRLLDHAAGLAYGVLKTGFRPLFMQRELATRQQAAACGVPVPSLVEVAPDGTWFSERYMSGTPVNRLSDKTGAYNAVVTVTEALQHYSNHTQQQETVADYVAHLAAQISQLITSNDLLDSVKRQELQQICQGLVQRLAVYAAEPVVTVQTHGDFQPANILLNQEGVWLIDWEYAARRQRFYDALVFNLSSRFPQGLADRLAEFVKMGWRDETAVNIPPQNIQIQTQRERIANLFLLEELQLHLEENSQPRFTKLGAGLQTLQNEIKLWLANNYQS